VKTLLELGAAVDCITNYLGYTALHKAVIGGHVDIVKYLLENRSNPNIQAKVSILIALTHSSTFLICQCMAFDRIFCNAYSLMYYSKPIEYAILSIRISLCPN
jgi:ankyrin repeat protein